MLPPRRHKSGEESVEHLWLHYSVAQDLLSSAISLFGVQLVMPLHVIDVCVRVFCSN
jgi:hypothetical protein